MEPVQQQISTKLTGNCLQIKTTFSWFSQQEEPLGNMSKELSTGQACLGSGSGTSTDTVSTNSVALGEGH